MAPSTQFLLSILILCVFLVLLDLGLYYLRKRQIIDWSKPVGLLDDAIQVQREKLGNFFSGMKIFQRKPTKSEPVSATEIHPAKTKRSVPASAKSSRAMTTRKTKAQESQRSTSAAPVRVQITADIPEGTEIQFTVKAIDKHGKVTIRQETMSGEPGSSDPGRPREAEVEGVELEIQKRSPALPRLPVSITQIGDWLAGIRDRLASQKSTSYPGLFLGASIAIYGIIVASGIDRFPIYFFTDEAANVNFASDFIRDHFKNYFGEFMPTFFVAEGWVNGVSVYVQVIPYLLFGKSVIVARLVSAFISLLGALAISLLLKNVFKIRYYWAGMLFLLTTPAWFLHSRTVFEYLEVASFYSIFLYCYARYRDGHLNYLYAAIIAGALTFYTHGLGQFLMAVSGLALFVIDFRYHIHPDRRKTVLIGLALGIILLLPFVRFYLAHPTEAADQVKKRGSYWSDDGLSFLDKSLQFLTQYAYGLNPLYWYFPNNVDLVRHIMKDYGNGLWPTLPFALFGFYKCIRNIKIPAYRIVLVALFACPVPASVVAIGMPRMLWMAVPLAILTTLGVSGVLQWVDEKLRFGTLWLEWGLILVLTGVSLYMFRDALVNGPTWFQDYGLYGMQYGAQQLFQNTALPELEQDPNRHIVISPSWSNGTEQFEFFFIPPDLQSRLNLGQPIDYINAIKNNTPDLYFIATTDEYNKIVQDPKYKDVTIQKIIWYPNGQPGFYEISLKASDNFDQIVAAQDKLNRSPVIDTMKYNGETVKVVHSPLGSGRLEDIFDNNPDTLARVLEANPFLIDVYWPTPMSTHSVLIQTGSLPNFTVTISLYAPGATEPVVYSQTYTGLPPDPVIEMSFKDGPAVSDRTTIEIKDNTSGDTSQIHIRTILFK